MMVLEVLLAGAVCGWIALGVLSFWSARGAPILNPGEGAELPESPPRVSIILAARNEEDALAATLESLLALDYPDYEIILVDDDSTDRTGAIAEEFAARPEGKLRVIHNRQLPPGWRGKVHALHLAASEATGNWLLATDADIVLHRAALRLAVACALRENARLLSLFPDLEFGSFWERVVLPAFTFLLAVLFPIRLLNNPRSPRALAAGGFMLMRRDDHEALGGYERLRNVVIEDLRMAQTFKRSGRRIFVALTRGLLRTRMYHNWREMWEGLARSAFEGTGFSVAKVLGGLAAGALLGILPWTAAIALTAAYALGFEAAPAALGLALAACAISVIVYLPYLDFLRVSRLYAFMVPLASAFYSGVALTSVWRSLRGRGVAWKGRHYRPP